MRNTPRTFTITTKVALKTEGFLATSQTICLPSALVRSLLAELPSLQLAGSLPVKGKPTLSLKRLSSPEG